MQKKSGTSWIQQSWWCLKENLVKERQNTADKGSKQKEKKRYEKMGRKCFRCWSRGFSAAVGEILLEQTDIHPAGCGRVNMKKLPEETVAHEDPTLEQV